MKSRPCAVVFRRLVSNRLTISRTRSTPAVLAMSAVLAMAAMLFLRPRSLGIVEYLRVRRIENAAELGAADVAHGLDGVCEQLLAGLDDGRILARDVGVERKAHGDGDLEVKRLRLFGQAVEVEFLGPKIGELDQPVAAGGRLLHRLLEHGLSAAAGPDERMNSQSCACVPPPRAQSMLYSATKYPKPGCVKSSSEMRTAFIVLDSPTRTGTFQLTAL